MKAGIRKSIFFTDWIFLGFVLWFGSGVYAYTFTQGGPKPLYSYILFLGFTLFFMLARAALNIPLFNKNDKWLWAFLTWLAAYLFFVVAGFLYSSQSELAEQALVTAIESSLLAGSFSYFMNSARVLRKVSVVMAFLALLAVGINISDFLNPVFSSSPGRAAGFYINPNEAGYFIALVMVAGVTAIPRRLRLVYLSACGIGILLTFSRSAFLMLVVAVIGLWWQRQIGGRSRLVATVVCLALFGGVLLAVFSGDGGGILDGSPIQAHLTQDTQSRMDIVNYLSTEYREDLVSYSLEAFSEAPVFGHGLGYTGEWDKMHRPHNMFLMFLVEGGLLGGALYVALVLLMLYFTAGIGRLLAVQIIIQGIFSHNVLEGPLTVMMIAYVFARGAEYKNRNPLFLKVHTLQES